MHELRPTARSRSWLRSGATNGKNERSEKCLPRPPLTAANSANRLFRGTEPIGKDIRRRSTSHVPDTQQQMLLPSHTHRGLVALCRDPELRLRVNAKKFRDRGVVARYELSSLVEVTGVETGHTATVPTAAVAATAASPAFPDLRTGWIVGSPSFAALDSDAFCILTKPEHSPCVTVDFSLTGANQTPQSLPKRTQRFPSLASQ